MKGAPQITALLGQGISTGGDVVVDGVRLGSGDDGYTFHYADEQLGRDSPDPLSMGKTIARKVTPHW